MSEDTVRHGPTVGAVHAVVHWTIEQAAITFCGRVFERQYSDRNPVYWTRERILITCPACLAEKEELKKKGKK